MVALFSSLSLLPCSQCLNISNLTGDRTLGMRRLQKVANGIRQDTAGITGFLPRSVLESYTDRHYHITELELELELIQSHMAQKPMLRGEVGARALRVRSDVRGHYIYSVLILVGEISKYRL